MDQDCPCVPRCGRARHKFLSGGGTWTYTSGTGKFKGIKGKGTFKGTPNADGTVAYHVEGTYSLL